MADKQIEITEICNKIYRKNDEIELIASSLEEAANKKATAISKYDKAITITVLKLRNGLIKEFTDEETGEIIEIASMPASSLEKIARGIVYKECFEKEEKEALYKAKISILDAKKSQLNGLQSTMKVLQ
ncbi:hypothetical protein [Sunxiuqinia indica]|uniref:hypothetical protein n=1 Tax=Sunxiuqinia indica TaxID=2692584 RepID=UPI0013583F84|nr:hypothetical protein [Sunxiuqinia indica]